MSTGKLKFENLEYIVMEGGGARGAAYLGAIRALEKKMAIFQAENSAIIHVYPLSNRKPALLDYYKIVEGNEVPVIKGIGGASAGCIATFALALGFNSEEIENILRYPFKNFLQDTDAGTYRMVNADGTLAVGQHKKNIVTNNKELVFSGKFEFRFNENFTPIGDISGNRIKRSLLFGTIFKIIVDGTVANFQQVTNFIGRLAKIDNPEDAPSFWRGLFRWAARPNNRLLQKIGTSKLLSLLLFKVIVPKVAKAPLQFDPDNLMAAVFDAGMFSGFKVREFFMDMMIVAATKDTQLHRGFVKIFDGHDAVAVGNFFGPEALVGVGNIYNTKDISPLLRSYETTFKLGERTTSKIGQEDNLRFALKCLSVMTFKHFNTITKINFGACVSNFTTGNPVYFGHEWTPDFLVMEAVAASMSIPPAIRPLYNQANVVKDDATSKLPFIDFNGRFELSEYYLYEHAVKLALQEEIQNDPKTLGTFVNVNNAIDVSTFLPKLRAIVNGEYSVTPDHVTMDPPDTNRKTVVRINGRDITVDYSLYKFYFNAVYKGLFLDGGYRNNIPYNFFRLRNENIDRVFAIKLDEHFPPPLMDEVYNKIKTMLDKIETSEIIADIDLSELDIPAIESGAITEIINNTKPTIYKVTKEEIFRQTELIFDKYLAALETQADNETDRKKIRQLHRELKKDKRPIRKLAKSTIKTYRKKRLSPPWMQPVNLIQTALDGYGYGSEKGQVKQITDHNQILPLYDYGIGTYDFDMDKIRPMIDLAQSESEKATLDFFTG